MSRVVSFILRVPVDIQSRTPVFLSTKCKPQSTRSRPEREPLPSCGSNRRSLLVVHAFSTALTDSSIADGVRFPHESRAREVKTA